MIVDPDEKKSDRLVALWPSAEVTRSVPTRNYISQDTFPITLTATPPVRSQLSISDARRIGDIELWVAISPTLPVEAKINLIAPRHGPTDIVIQKILPSAQSNVVFESADRDTVARCPEHSDVCRVAVAALIRSAWHAGRRHVDLGNRQSHDRAGATAGLGAESATQPAALHEREADHDWA